MGGRLTLRRKGSKDPSARGRGCQEPALTLRDELIFRFQRRERGPHLPLQVVYFADLLFASQKTEGTNPFHTATAYRPITVLIGSRLSDPQVSVANVRFATTPPLNRPHW